MISLKKNQVLDLGDQTTKTKDRLSFGLGWSKKVIQTPLHQGGFWGFGGEWSMRTTEEAVDLDASCLLYDRDGNLQEVIYFGNLNSQCGSIAHSGDDQVGGGPEDAPNEFIFITLSKIPDGVDTIIFTVSCYSGDTFKGIPNAYCNVYDRGTNSELARFNLQIRARDSKGFIIAKVTRANEHWNFITIGQPLGGRQRTINDLMPFAEACL